jgi:hypothetical protein
MLYQGNAKNTPLILRSGLLAASRRMRFTVWLSFETHARALLRMRA